MTDTQVTSRVGGARTRIPAAQAAAVLRELSKVNPFFSIGTGPIAQDGWRSVQQLYTDTSLLDGIVGRVQARIGASERRVAVSTFVLGFAARLWSIGLGALAGHRTVPDLAAGRLLFFEDGGQIRLHVERPVAWQGNDLEPMLADAVLELHIGPLTAAVQRLGPISNKVLRGNVASALLGAASVFDSHQGGAVTGRGWQLARSLCADERLSGAVTFSADGTEYRRASCCLYYRTRGGVLCGDCILTPKSGTKPSKECAS